MIARTSAKSRLIRPGTVMMSLMPGDALAQDVVDDPERVDDRGVLLDDVAQPVVGDRDQRVDLGLELLGRLLRDELAPAPSKLNGLVTTPIVSAPCSLAISATTGAAPEPVPPPRPAVMNTMSESASASAILSRSSSAARCADRRVAAGAEAAGDLVADADLVRRVGLQERLGVRVAGDELDAHHLGADHPVDGVAATAADADDADQGEVLGVGTQRHRRSPDVSNVATGDAVARRVGGVPVAGPASRRGCRVRAGVYPRHVRACPRVGHGPSAASAAGSRGAGRAREIGRVRVALGGCVSRRGSSGGRARVALSALGSSRAIDCQVPSASRPAMTGTVSDGAASSGSTWSAPWPGDPWRCVQRSSRGSSRSSAVDGVRRPTRRRAR